MIFDTLSQVISRIASHNYGNETIFHRLDDFLTVDKSDLCTGLRTKALLDLIFAILKVPLSHHVYRSILLSGVFGYHS